MTELTLENIVGKTILVGLSFYSAERKLLNREQFFGMVISTAPDRITIELESGAIRTIPADLRSTKSAPQGEYRLRSTGQIVVNPDLLSTWNIIRDE